MASRTRPTMQKRWWSQNSRWWLLSAALGVLTLLSMVGIVHDRTAQRAAGRLAARAAAEQVVALATGRLKLVSLGSFAPVTEWVGHNALPGRIAVNALAVGQRHGERCQCRLTVPATDFFRFAVGSGSLDGAFVNPGGAVDALPPPLLADLAMAEARRPVDRGDSQVHLLRDPRLGARLLVMVTQRDDNGAATSVDGLVADARATIGVLFAPE